MTENQISKVIVNTAFEIHQRLGPGLLENVYKTILAHQLRKKGHSVDVEKQIGITYDDLTFTNAYRVDIIVDNKVIIEIKAINATGEQQKSQLLTYVKLSQCKLGLLINFNETLIKNGIRRVVNGL